MLQSGNREITFHEAIQAAIAEEMQRDPHVFMLGFEVSLRSGLQAEFGPRRVLDTPISELGVTGLGIGAARRGMKPVIDLMGSSFFFLAMDQIANHAAITHYLFNGQLPASLVILGMTGIGDVVGAAHHGRMPHPLLMGIPGLKVVFPSDALDAKRLMKAAIRDPNPVVFLEHVRLYRTKMVVPSDDEILPLGSAVIKRPGRDVSVVAIGPMVGAASEAAAELETGGISVEIIDPRTLSPLDFDTILESLSRTGRMVVVDEAHDTCSAARHIAAVVAERGSAVLKAPIKVLTVPQTNIPFSSGNIFEHLVPTAARIRETIHELLGAKAVLREGNHSKDSFLLEQSNVE